MGVKTTASTGGGLLNLSGLPLMILITMSNALCMAWFGYDQGT